MTSGFGEMVERFLGFKDAHCRIECVAQSKYVDKTVHNKMFPEQK